QENEQLIVLDEGDNLTTRVIGPRNTRQSPVVDASCEIRVQVDRASRSLLIYISGNSEKLSVREHGWSDWARFKFKFSLLQSVTGTARIYVRQIEPHVEFYVSA